MCVVGGRYCTQQIPTNQPNQTDLFCSFCLDFTDDAVFCLIRPKIVFIGSVTAFGGRCRQLKRGGVPIILSPSKLESRIRSQSFLHFALLECLFCRRTLYVASAVHDTQVWVQNDRVGLVPKWPGSTTPNRYVRVPADFGLHIYSQYNNK